MPHLCLVALVLGFSSLIHAPNSPATSVDDKLALIALAVASLWALAAWIASLRSELACSQRWLDRLQVLFHLCYVAVMGMVFGPFEFARIAAVNAGGSGWVAVDELFVLGMLVLPLVVAWRILAEPVALETGMDVGALVGQQLRFTFMLPVVPIVAILAIDDLFRLGEPPSLAGLSSAGLRAFLSLSVIAAFILVLPDLLRVTWDTEVMADDAARRQISDVLRQYQVGVREILRWDTHGMHSNAAVAGFCTRLRYLFVTDELLRRLNGPELAAITAHEAAHFRHRHLPKLASSLLLPILGIAHLTRCAEQGGVTAWLPVPIWGAVSLMIWAIVHRAWARAFEHHADLTACRSPGGVGAVCPQAVATFGRALDALGANPDGDWLHPAPCDRMDFVTQMSQFPDKVDRFERKLLFWHHCQSAISLLLAIALFIVS